MTAQGRQAGKDQRGLQWVRSDEFQSKVMSALWEGKGFVDRVGMPQCGQPPSCPSSLIFHLQGQWRAALTLSGCLLVQ